MQFPTLGGGGTGGVGDSPRWTAKNSEAPELDVKTRKVADKFTEALEAIANEPTLALYRVQEHTRKSLPTLVEKRLSMIKQRERVEGMTYDIDLAANAVKTLRKSDLHFQNIQDLLKNSMFMKQQLEYQSGKRKKSEANESMYSRPQLRMSRPYSINDFPLGTGDISSGNSPSVVAAASSSQNNGDSMPSSSSTKKTVTKSSSVGYRENAVSMCSRTVPFRAMSSRKARPSIERSQGRDTLRSDDNDNDVIATGKTRTSDPILRETSSPYTPMRSPRKGSGDDGSFVNDPVIAASVTPTRALGVSATRRIVPSSSDDDDNDDDGERDDNDDNDVDVERDFSPRLSRDAKLSPFSRPSTSSRLYPDLTELADVSVGTIRRGIGDTRRNGGEIGFESISAQITDRDFDGKTQRRRTTTTTMTTTTVTEKLTVKGYNGESVSRDQLEYSRGDRPSFKPLLCFFIVAIVALALVAINFFLCDRQSNGGDLNLRETGKMAELFNSLRASFPNQPRRSWLNFNGPIRRILREGSDSEVPAVLLLAGDPTTVRHLVSETAALLHSELAPDTLSNPLIFEALKMGTGDPYQTKNSMDDDLRRYLGEGGKVVVIYDVDELPPQATLLLHGFADDQFAPFKHSLFFLTVGHSVTPRSSADEIKEMEKRVSQELTGKLTPDLGVDATMALMNRIATSVVVVTPETIHL